MPNGPDKAEELTGNHGRNGQRRSSSLGELSVARAESMLGFRGDGDHRRGLIPLPRAGRSSVIRATPSAAS